VENNPWAEGKGRLTTPLVIVLATWSWLGQLERLNLKINRAYLLKEVFWEV